jgi:hypothetical protein
MILEFRKLCFQQAIRPLVDDSLGIIGQDGREIIRERVRARTTTIPSYSSPTPTPIPLRAGFPFWGKSIAVISEQFPIRWS